MNKYLIYLFIFLTFPVNAAADVSVSLSLQRNEAAFADTVRMTVSVSGSRDAEAPEIKGLENFKAQAGGRSSRVQIVNGKVNSSLDFTYYLQAKKTGIFDIGPASVKIDGKSYQSNTVKLAVKDSVDQKSAGTGTGASLFMTASLSSRTLYLEEQAEYTIRLYYLNDVSNVSLSMPESDGISFKQTGKPAEYNTVYNSRNYNVIEIKYTLIPSKAGRININPARMSMLVRGGDAGGDNSDDMFSMDDFFSGARGRSVSLASNPLVLDVLSVPEYGRPADYAGLIGSYRISSELTPGRIKSGESATLTVVVKGRGNINRIPDLSIPDMENIKIYADEPKLETSGINEGSKTMKWAIVPIKEGAYQLPQLSVSYFDTSVRAFRTIKTAPARLMVDRGTGAIAESPFAKGKPAAGKEEVEELGKDILPIHRSADSSPISMGIWIYWLIILLPAAVFGSILGFTRIKRSTKREQQFRALRAANIFYRICRGNAEISADRLSGALRDYFNSRFSLDLGSLSPQEASEILRGKGCDETATQMEWLLKKVEILIYTGKGADPCDLAEEAIVTVRSIEKEIK